MFLAVAYFKIGILSTLSLVLNLGIKCGSSLLGFTSPSSRTQWILKIRYTNLSGSYCFDSSFVFTSDSILNRISYIFGASCMVIVLTYLFNHLYFRNVKQKIEHNGDARDWVDGWGKT